MTDPRLRLLLLDDNPTFIESATGLPSFAAASGLKGRELFERNYSLSWMYDLGQAKEYAARTRIALIDDPTQLLECAAYPNILWFDYCMDQAEHKGEDLEELDSLEIYRSKLNPLRGDWGRKIEIFGLTEEQFAAAVEWHPLPGEDQHGGCLAGVDISSLLDPYAYVGVPQTMHHNLKATMALEWHLSCHLGSLFARKSETPRNWFHFLKNALPPLRDKLVLGSRRGSLIPRIGDLLAIEGEGDVAALGEKAVTFQSQLGTEALRIEALFLDVFYRWDGTGDCPLPNAPEDVLKEVMRWSSELLEAASGPGRQTAVREGLATAVKFIAAHADLFHYQRRALSRELADAAPEEIDLAVEQNAVILEALGFSTKSVASALHDRQSGRLEMSDSAAIAWGTLDSIDKEAATDEAARYAAIALMVWGELAWQGSVLGDVDTWLEQMEEVIAAPTTVSAAMKERLQALSGLYVPDETLNRIVRHLGEAGYKSELLRTLGRDAAIFAAIQEHQDLNGPRTPRLHRGLEDSQEPRQRATQEIEAKHNFLRYLFAPAPRKLMFWQEAGSDVDKPLARLGDPEGALKFRIRAVLEGRPPADGGLRPGELQLVRLFAREFGFAERYWPAWMRRPT